VHLAVRGSTEPQELPALQVLQELQELAELPELAELQEVPELQELPEVQEVVPLSSLELWEDAALSVHAFAWVAQVGPARPMHSYNPQVRGFFRLLR